jgi:hypothetical protein
MTETEKTQILASPHAVSETISNCLRSANSGTVRIDIDRQPFLKLTINQADINIINLEFGQKFMEMLLAAGMEMISSKIRNLT